MVVLRDGETLDGDEGCEVGRYCFEARLYRFRNRTSAENELQREGE